MRDELKPRLIDIEQTAKYLSLSPKTIRNRIGPKAKNPFPVKPKRVGRKVLFDIRDIDRYIDSIPTKS